MITGVLIAALLGVHMIVMHLDAVLGFFGITIDEITSWESMMERAGQRFWVILYIALLIFALYHAFNGLRGIILELVLPQRTQRIIDWAIIVLGVIFCGLGIYAPIVLLY
jgi:succinate dehydrogenase hydrophobic anchor subunit